MSETFMSAVLSGDALWIDADDWVARWHDGDGSDIELHDFLGMTWDDYRLWTERPQALRMIIAAHERDEPVERYVAEAGELAIAARGVTANDWAVVLKWLKRTGRIPQD